RARNDRVGWALERVALHSRASRRISDLSGGALRRLALAQAILGAPRLLLVDAPREPVGPVATAHLDAILRSLAADGAAIVVVARAADAIADVATRLIFLEGGVIC